MRNHAALKQAPGFALIAVLMTMSVLLALLSAYSLITRLELATHKSAADSLNGFYAAEAGLNLRADDVRQTFVGYNRPSGTSPDEDDPCEGGNQGTGDFACESFDLGKHRALTYVIEEPGNPVILTIPPGERYQNLNAQEYRYTVTSQGLGTADQIEAILELRFKSRLVPMFQFAVFYDKDLEILPGPAMTLNGPVHTNGDLYLNNENASGLSINGQVTTAKNLYRGRKNQNVCNSNPVKIKDPLNYRTLFGTCSNRILVEEDDITSWNGMIQMQVPEVTVPEPEEFDPIPGKTYWDKSDLRLVLNLDNAGNPVTTAAATGVEVRTMNDSVNSSATQKLNDPALCPGAIATRSVGTTTSFYNNREARNIRMLEIDMQALLDCIHTQNLMVYEDGAFTGTVKPLNDTTEGGLVFYATVKGPNSATTNSGYGVRVRNAGTLAATASGAPAIKGLTIISDQGLYTWGNYNSSSKKPAAFLVDSYNLLSSAFVDGAAWASRVPVNTTVNAAILAGTDITGGTEGAGGQDDGSYNGGLENYPRFHEDWSKSPQKTVTYAGSFVSLSAPRHVTGAWLYGSPQYTAPVRAWSYDTSFNNAENLPPITPRFVYLRQQLFLRDYEQE